MDRQNAINLAVLGGCFHGNTIVLGRGIFRDIDQIGQRSELRQLRLQRCHGFGREPTQIQEDLVDPVGRQHAGPAAIGHDGQAPPDRTVARCQALGRRKSATKERTRTAPARRRGGIEDIIAAHDGAAVGLGRLLPAGLRPALSTTTGLALAASAARS